MIRTVSLFTVSARVGDLDTLEMRARLVSRVSAGLGVSPADVGLRVLPGGHGATLEVAISNQIEPRRRPLLRPSAAAARCRC